VGLLERDAITFLRKKVRTGKGLMFGKYDEGKNKYELYLSQKCPAKTVQLAQKLLKEAEGGSVI
jgi:hypothetical protein